MKNSHRSHSLYNYCCSSIKRPVYMLAVALSLTACGGSGSTVTAPTVSTTPSTTQNITATAIVSNRQATLTWAEVTGASSYNLYYATESLSNLVPVNYQTATSAVRLVGVTSPHVITSLNNAQAYFFILTMVTSAGAESVISNEISATPAAPPPLKPLNDTGITDCGDAMARNLSCPVDDFPNQDAQNGRDAQTLASLNKVGAGKGGFDFSRLDSAGEVLAVPSTTSPINWSCVKDNHTGLIWEVKTDDDGLQDKDHDYTWYDPSSITNGGDTGTQDDGACNGSDCDTTAYAASVNALSGGLCGATDWRVPTREEIRSIVNYSSFTLAIDAAYFPNTETANRYWSSTAYSNNNIRAWSINFTTGVIEEENKDQSRHIRLVRSKK